MIAGVLLLVVGMVAVAGGSFSWVLFPLAIWLTMWMLFGGRRRQRRRMRWAHASQQVPPMVTPVQVPYPVVPSPAPTPRPQPAVRRSAPLPDDVERKADRIRRKAAVLGQHADRFPLGSKDLYVVEHTATDYLPATLNAFQEVPSWSVDTPAVDGRTPLQMLHAQLDILERNLDEIADRVRSQRVDRLLANGRFLEERFGRPDDDELTIPAQR